MLKQLWENFSKKLQKSIRRFNNRMRNRSAIRRWHKAGSPYPAPDEYSQELIKQYALAYSIDTLIETGTGSGKMPEALQDDFIKIYAIELNLELYLNAKEKFHDLQHVEIIKGDSSEQIKELLANIHKPVLIWLDTHGNYDPKGYAKIAVTEELNAILKSGTDHIILISNARLFTGENNYQTLIGIRNFIASLRPDYNFEVENDVIRVGKKMNA